MIPPRRLLCASIGLLSLLSAFAAPPKEAVRELSGVTIPGLPPVTGHIHVDQFGYLPSEKKVAVVSDPMVGYNVEDHFAPGRTYELRRVMDGEKVFSAKLVAFRKGATDEASGDRGWWFDFSEVKEAGQYYILDSGTGVRSPIFRIADDVYRDVLRAAVRVFYYQREALAHQPPQAEAPWVDGPSYLQDRKVRSVLAKEDPASERDLSGGWMDAGDTNKYPPFLKDVIHPLLNAWKKNPMLFSDDTGIPESGNGLPDVLDEVKWELDWLQKMQDDDGGVWVKMGEINYGSRSPLSTDTRPRYYGPKSSGATLVTAGIFAHAARILGGFAPWRSYGGELGRRAELAWAWVEKNGRNFKCDTGEIKSGNADMDAWDQDRAEALAAVYLWKITGKAKYHQRFKELFEQTKQMKEAAWSAYEPSLTEALLEYANSSNADPKVSERILTHLSEATAKDGFMPQVEDKALYRAWMSPESFHWGNNTVRAGYGIMARCAEEAGCAGDRADLARQRALDMLHSFHGVNPLSVVYLTNMGRYGAENSVMRIWHDWFSPSSPFAANPPPGYVTGGPNRDYGGSVEWFKKQPWEKCYGDFNDGYPQNSWEFSEPAIYYQAMYVRLLVACMSVPASER